MTTFMNAKNFAQSTLASGITASDTSLTVQSGDGAKFPTVPFNVVLSGVEIVSVTAKNGDVFTITRAQENTVAQAHSAGASVELNVTAQYLTDAYTEINNIESGTTQLQSITTAGDVNTTAQTINLFANASTVNMMGGSGGAAKYFNIGSSTIPGVVRIYAPSSVATYPHIGFYTDGTQKFSIGMNSNTALPYAYIIDSASTYRHIFDVTNRTSGSTNVRYGSAFNTITIGSAATSSLTIFPPTIAAGTASSNHSLWENVTGNVGFATSSPNVTIGASASGKTTVRNAFVFGGSKTFTANATSQDVSGANIFIVPGTWSAGNNINNLTNGTTGQVIVILGGDSDCQVVTGGNIKLSGGSAWTAAVNATLTLVFDGTNWQEVSRSTNS